MPAARTPRALALVLGLASLPALAPLARAQTWRVVGDLGTPWWPAFAVLLQNGRVLVGAGWEAPDGTTSTQRKSARAVVFDPATGTTTRVADLNFPRPGSVAFRLPDGRVYVLGGFCFNCPNQTPPPEIFEPRSGTFSVQPAAPSALSDTVPNRVTQLADGNYFVSSGNAYIFDPATLSYTPVGTAAASGTPNYCQALLKDGRVLLVGGQLPEHGVAPDAPAQIFDPTDDSWETLQGGPHVWNPACSVLADGRVLIAGGSGQFDPGFHSEIFDPSADRFSTVGVSLYPLAGAAFALPSGHVVLPSSAFAELFDPIASQFSQAGIDPAPLGPAVQLPDGALIQFGGEGAVVTTSEYYSRRIAQFDEAAKAFTLSVPANPALAGGFGSVPIATLPIGNFAGQIQLSCSPLRFATCSVTPASVPAGESTALQLSMLAGPQLETIVGESPPYSYWTTTVVNGPDLVIVATPTSLTVPLGNAGAVQLQFTCDSSFPLTMTCSGLPPGATCAFNPAQPQASAAYLIQASLAIAVPAASGMPWTAAWLPLILAAVTLLAPRRARRWAVVTLTAVALSGCGSGSIAGTYPIVIQAAYKNISASTTIALTIP